MNRMSVLAVIGWISPEEYLKGERFSEVRHEYLDGRVYAMAGASDDHNRIAGNLFAELRARLRGKDCEPFIQDMKLKIEPGRANIFYYPDVMVVCDPSDRAKYFRERPSLIIEVLSPETERLDRGEKATAYQQIASLRYYVLIEQDRMAATILRRISDGWETQLAEGPLALLEFHELQLQIPFSVIYERSAVAAQTF